MITLQDCIAFCGLEEDQVLAIAEHEHEHMPEIVAASLAQYLLHREHGCEIIRDMIADDVRGAQRRGDKQHVRILLHILHRFMKAHPGLRFPKAHSERALYEEFALIG